jgi:hypothetical protein
MAPPPAPELTHALSAGGRIAQGDAMDDLLHQRLRTQPDGPRGLLS